MEPELELELVQELLAVELASQGLVLELVRLSVPQVRQVGRLLALLVRRKCQLGLALVRVQA